MPSVSFPSPNSMILVVHASDLPNCHNHSVAKSFREKFAALADSPEPMIYTAGYQHIPVDMHIPILDVQNLPDKQIPRYLSKAVIQGTLNEDRRDYKRIFRDLIVSLQGAPLPMSFRQTCLLYARGSPSMGI